MPGTTNKVDDPCQECRERHLKCDDTRPRCRQCERLGEKCHRSGGRLKFRPGSSAKYDTTFGKDQTWLSQTKIAKIQFVDQGPELENFYSHDDLDDQGNGIRIATTIGLESSGAPLHRSYTTSSVHTSLSPETRSPVNYQPNFSGLPILSPTSTLSNGNNPRSPLKRSLPDDIFANNPQRRVDSRPKGSDDPIRTSYNLYGYPGSYNQYHSTSRKANTAQRHVPTSVDAENKRIADAYAGAIPENSKVLEPSVWREHFYWPNVDTTTQCACLMKYFIEKLAPWFDAGDPERTFSTAVPQRARRCPPLLNAIFTAAARHLTLFPEYRSPGGHVVYEGIILPTLTKDTCVSYHNACIAYLKKLADDPQDVQDENLLAAAVIERYYGELDAALEGRDDTDSQFATFNLFFRAQARNTPCDISSSPPSHLWPHCPLPSTSSHHHRDPHQSALPSENALHQLKSFQHACFRVALRQEITTAFLKQRSITLPLCSTWSLLDTSFTDAETPDFVWADRHLHHCAKVLQFCFGDSNTGNARDRLSLSALTNTETHRDAGERWRAFKSYQQEWEKRKPLSFSPIDEWGRGIEVLTSPDRRGSGGGGGGGHDMATTTGTGTGTGTIFIFPKIWYMAETHVIALQYLSLARILLTVYNPDLPRLGAGAVMAQKRVSEDVCELVVRVCATAMSRGNSQPARMQAFMAVCVCGERFGGDVERNALLQLLKGLEVDFGWPTEKARRELLEAWRWL